MGTSEWISGRNEGAMADGGTSKERFVVYRALDFLVGCEDTLDYRIKCFKSQ